MEGISQYFHGISTVFLRCFFGLLSVFARFSGRGSGEDSNGKVWSIISC
jgi:hypothetical protein